MWGSDEDRFQAIESQLEILVTQVNRFVEAVTAAIVAEAESQEAPAEGLPQDNNIRSELFWGLVQAHAVDNGFWIKSRNVPEHRKVAAFLGVHINSVIEYWGAYVAFVDDGVQVTTRIPTDWFEKLKAATEAGVGGAYHGSN